MRECQRRSLAGGEDVMASLLFNAAINAMRMPTFRGPCPAITLGGRTCLRED